MSRLINNENLQHYTNKMCNADNRKVGSKSLPTALNDIDSLIDEMKTNFNAEYGTPLCMKLENNENVFSVGTGTNVDKRSEVENSFTDVELSGNSLVNLWVKRNGSANLNDVVNNTNNEYAGVIKAGSDCGFTSHISNIKSDTYTVIFDLKTDSTLAKPKIMFFDYGGLANPQNTTLSTAIPNTGWNTYMLTKNVTKTNGATLLVGVNCPSSEIGLQLLVRNIIVLEGDWTNKPIPQYFEGMKSVGQDDVNGHKIEILSKNKNLFNVNDFKFDSICNGVSLRIEGQEIVLNGTSTNSYTRHSLVNYLDYMKDNTTYTLSGSYMMMEISYNDGRVTWKTQITTDKSNMKKITVYLQWLEPVVTFDNLRIRPMLEEGNVVTAYATPNLNKKEISLNEPLRGLPNGTRDTIEKIDNEWKLIRRCGFRTITGDEHWTWSNSGQQQSEEIIAVYFIEAESKEYSVLLSDKQASLTKYEWDHFVREGIYRGSSGFGLTIRRNRLSDSSSLVPIKEWIKDNKFDVIYELPQPIIEDIDPITLQCWKNGTISIDEVLPVETTHTVALNKPAQIKRNIEELTELRNRVKRLEDTLDTVSLDQALQFQLLNHSINLDK